MNAEAYGMSNEAPGLNHDSEGKTHELCILRHESS